MTLSDYLDSLEGKRIGVVGAGISNLPLIRLLLSRGCDLTVCDARDGDEPLFDELGSLGAKLRLGKGYLDELDFDIIFRTPGLHSDRLKAAAKAVITSEMEAFFKVCPCKTIAVTGSDGKTTTTTIISELLKKQGYTVHLGGNIGNPLLAEVDSFSPGDMAVLELSSFQLHSMSCSPDIAVITNISPNHLDVHPDMADYVDAKRMIYKSQKPGSRLVLNADDPYTPEIRSEAAGEVLTFSRRRSVENGAYMQDGRLYLEGELMPAGNVRLPGLHNIENYLAAFAATKGLVSNETRVAVAESFSGVRHRLELIRELRGIKFYNDSIASSPSRTIAGLRSFEEKPILIAGGKDKGVPFDELGLEISKRVKALFLTGMTAEAINAAVSGIPVTIIDGFEDTIRAAYAFAESGDIILLSPACTSFDRFKSFAERGDEFRRIVLELE